MAFRSKSTLEQWLADFRSERSAGELIKVIVQDGSDGADTGLVIVPLRSSTISIFMEPIHLGDARWRITLEPHPDTTILSSHQLHGLAVELGVAAELCAYLEARSVGHAEEETPV